MADNDVTIGDLKARIRAFISERKWEKVHSPKNLSMSLAIEVSELMEHFQWVTEEESRGSFKPEELEKIKEELADVAIYLLDLSDVLMVDLSDAIKNKIIKNAKKYPVGSSVIRM